MPAIIVLLLSVRLVIPVLGAVNESYIESPDFDGYLVKISDSVRDSKGYLNSAENVAKNVYLVDDLSSVSDCVENGLVDYIEPNYYVSLFDENGTENAVCGWAYNAMYASYAGDLGLDGTGVRIAVIDSGVEATSEDLQDANIEAGYDYTGGASAMVDTLGHGTVVTAMIAGDDDNIGVTGIARDATIIPLKCFSSKSDATIANLASAIQDAVQKYNCNVINMSWGTTVDSSTLHAAVQAAYDAGAILVAAAGNVSSTVPQGTLVYPAAYDEVIGVSSVDSELKVASTSQQTTAVNACAPGDLVYGEESGTSFAAPCVAAVAALVRQLDSNIMPTDFLDLLEERAEDLGDTGYDTAYGYGFIRLDRIFGQSWRSFSTISSSVRLKGWMLHKGGGEVIAAAYDANGRMVTPKSVFSSADIFKFDFFIAVDKISHVNLFYLDSSLAPCSEAEVFSLTD